MEGGWQNNRQLGIHPDNRMVENIFEELDAPGEWFYAADEQVLYYYPLEGENVSRSPLRISAAQTPDRIPGNRSRSGKEHHA